MTRRVMVEDAYAGEDFGLIEGDRGCVITTPTASTWWSERSGRSTHPSPSCSPTASEANMGAFTFQRRRLARVWGDQVRMVFYDQRAPRQIQFGGAADLHGGTAGLRPETVLAVMAPRGSVILVGHSMGGMTVLSHARQFPPVRHRNRRRRAHFLCGRGSFAVAAGRSCRTRRSRRPGSPPATRRISCSAAAAPCARCSHRCYRPRRSGMPRSARPWRGTASR